MADFVNTIDILGDELTAKAIIERTITEYNDDIINSFGISAFYGCLTLTSANMPNVTSIAKEAFSNCSALTSVDLPNATSIDSNAFSYCSALTSVDLPNVKSIGSGVFQSCKALTSVELPSATSIGSNAFYHCSALTSVDLPNAPSIGQTVFKYCSNLQVLVLRSNAVCTLQNTSAFADTTFAAGKAGGTLLVPRAITESYPTATNWSSIFSGNPNNRVLALEDYTVDGTITGEIDWDKLNGGAT